MSERYYTREMSCANVWAVCDSQQDGWQVAEVFDEQVAGSICDFLNASTAAEAGEAVEVHRLLSSMASQKKTDEMTYDECEDADFETAYDIMVENARDLRRALAARVIVPVSMENNDG